MLYEVCHVANLHLLVPVLNTRVQVLLSACLRSSNLTVYKNTVTTHNTFHEKLHIKCICIAFNKVCVCVCVCVCVRTNTLFEISFFTQFLYPSVSVLFDGSEIIT